MKRQLASLLCVASLVVIPLAGACAQTQTVLNITADQNARRAEVQLRSVYGRAAAALDPAGRRKLAASEQTWMAYCRAEAGFEADLYRGGSMEPMVYANVQKALTEARIAQLQAILKEVKGR